MTPITRFSDLFTDIEERRTHRSNPLNPKEPSRESLPSEHYRSPCSPVALASPRSTTVKMTIAINEVVAVVSWK